MWLVLCLIIHELAYMNNCPDNGQLDASARTAASSSRLYADMHLPSLGSQPNSRDAETTQILSSSYRFVPAFR